MGSQALVTVIIPCYNAELYVEAAVRSIMEQTYVNLEIIVINDQSIDQTKAILLELATVDPRIKYVENEHNLKLIGTLNKGIQIAQGEYIARMDADDISLPERIEKQISYMEENPAIGLLGTFIDVFGDEVKPKQLKLPIYHDEIYSYLCVGSAFFHPTVVFRKSVLSANDLKYEDEFYRAEDHALWVKLSSVTKMANIPEALLKYRILPNSETRLAAKDVKQRHFILKQIHILALQRFGVKLAPDQQDDYSYSMNRANFNFIEPSKLLETYSLIIKSATQRTHFLIRHLSIRWIAVVFYKRIFLNTRYWKLFVSKFNYVGLISIVRLK